MYFSFLLFTIRVCLARVFLSLPFFLFVNFAAALGGAFGRELFLPSHRAGAKVLLVPILSEMVKIRLYVMSTTAQETAEREDSSGSTRRKGNEENEPSRPSVSGQKETQRRRGEVWNPVVGKKLPLEFGAFKVWNPMRKSPPTRISSSLSSGRLSGSAARTWIRRRRLRLPVWALGDA